ncbi:Na+/H+ antiporter subunit A [Schumannella sp. 10F1B-5-1]|uniref:Na+/H+ antiporter subunit A n=1 Tax=Schumannella sp. 10F1B-5-1 TaxID=2590780 RepID=UPI00113280B4|nr:Na+/H+ antiporter subunit A [Schumannella sp. 10F1B-5-1]TPW73613.1 Na+/H+ antiporter subunit A [Schumannella sp. 10F1B-5-1]
MIALLLFFALGGVLAPVLVRALGRSAFAVLALIPTAAFVHAAAQLPAVVGGGAVTERVPWIPALDVAISLRLDGLSTVMALIVAGVGALVLLYCARYFAPDAAALGRFAGVLTAFAGAMYGLVVADDMFVLFMFWEATSVLSYLLIAHLAAKATSRRAALQALIVTTLGGLVMFVGLILLRVETGTSSLAGVVDAHPTGPVASVAAVLIVVGVASKSALVPFHFWLPAAMAAPTPVSAYLHAAAMVKVGVYLALRLTPGLGDAVGWRESLLVLGLVTMLLGGLTALRHSDLKLVLAHGTVSQLGFLTAMAVVDTPIAALGAVALLLSHALFKSTLFLTVGVIDHDHGTRDLRKLSGLGRARPVLAVTAALAVLSMAGLPPTLGFVAKETVLTGLIEGSHDDGALVAVLVLVVAGSALTLAYGLRFLWGAFARKPGVAECRVPSRPNPLFVAPPVLLAASGLVLGPLASLIDPVLARAAADANAEGAPDYHLALWHGLEPALGLSALTLVLGVALFALIGRRTREAPGESLAPRLYGGAMHGVDVVAARVTGATQRGSLPFYLAVILVVTVGAVGAALVAAAGQGVISPEIRLADAGIGWAQAGVSVLMIVAAIAAARAQKRFPAVVFVGVTGTGMTALFALQGAPDLALTQLLVETVTLVAIVLVLRRLPARLGDRNGSAYPVARAIIGVAVGVLMAVVAVVAAGARTASPISVDWADLAVTFGHGENVVNVALVDLRGWDTMGELSVLIAAATGVASLVFVRTREDRTSRPGRREQRAALRERRAAAAAAPGWEPGRSAWLLAGRTLGERNRSILLEVVVRLVFHALVVFSVYLLFAGHNAPGGGFAGGLVVGLALAGRYLAGGRDELAAAAPFDAGRVLGLGMIFAAGTAAVPLFLGVDALTSTWFEAEIPVLGHLEFVTSTFFDVGVYLVVIGLALDVLRSLGAEVDRQYEEVGS